ncbi:cell division protein FtsL [Evansella caseinilytica]|uniref:Cell division protein FtsL n=1 Tax=Evansella caseinilytica TaxID=1503961 RepID=A0A1H3MIT9_9BACI|nr:cell division protein FtsL [Evansella caseinilytica]SDY76274.1 cell division protein FtsL [Evansella caseinilytica]
MSPLVQRQAETHTYPVKEKQSKKQRVFKGGITKGEKLIYCIALVALLFILYNVVSNYASIYVLNHQIQQQEQKIEDQRNVNESLSLQVTELSDPERILSEAKAMGMVLDDKNVKFTHSND